MLLDQARDEVNVSFLLYIREREREFSIFLVNPFLPRPRNSISIK